MAVKLDQRGFEERFLGIIEFAKDVEDAVVKGFHVIVEKPPLKSVAPRLVEYLALRNMHHVEAGLPSVPIYHLYLTKLVRKDTKEQLIEMSGYGIYCYAIENASHLDETIALIEGKLRDGGRVWVHLDEGDYGTKIDQVLSKLFYRIIDDKNCRIINYLAKNEEALLSSFNKNNRFKVVKPRLQGRGFFMAKDFVKQSEPFWDFNSNCLTRQGLEAIDLLQNSEEKLFGVLRLPDCKIALNDPSFTKFFNDKDITVLFIEDGKGDWEKYVHDNKKVLLVLNTSFIEVGFYKQPVFWHDHRTGVLLNTRIQAYGRNNHYDENGRTSNEIH